MPDVLSDVLGTLRFRGQVYGSLELPAPWGLRAAARDEFAFHLVARGRCWLEVGDRPAIHASAGDVLVLSPQHAHVLRDAPKSRVRPIEDVVRDLLAGRVAPPDPNNTMIVCGAFRVDDAALLAGLPPVIHTHELASDAGPWLAQTAKLLAFESCGEHPGAAAIVERLCDALFVYVIRSVLTRLPSTEATWLRALVTPKIRDALQLIHDDPKRAWSVASLAAKVGMSRSAFAERFSEVVGVTPMQYVIAWRMQKAATLLRSGDAGIGEIAAEVGYASNVAFAKAFKRALGLPPGEYRAQVSAPPPRSPAGSAPPRTASRGAGDRAGSRTRAPAA
jgi:AraC-like DNA-binding protein